jgi:hypothetical protein
LKDNACNRATERGERSVLHAANTWPLSGPTARGFLELSQPFSHYLILSSRFHPLSHSPQASSLFLRTERTTRAPWRRCKYSTAHPPGAAPTLLPQHFLSSCYPAKYLKDAWGGRGVVGRDMARPALLLPGKDGSAPPPSRSWKVGAPLRRCCEVDRWRMLGATGALFLLKPLMVFVDFGDSCWKLLGIWCK